jgi:hypothetical protein
MNGPISQTLTIAILAAALAACGGGVDAANNEVSAEASANEAAASEAEATNEAAPVTPAAVEIGGAPTVDYMVGKWSAMDEDCSDTLEFRKDGTLTTPIADAKWTLVGDKLTMDYGDGSKQPASSIKVLSQDRIEITTGSGRKETQKRC